MTNVEQETPPFRLTFYSQTFLTVVNYQRAQNEPVTCQKFVDVCFRHCSMFGSSSRLSPICHQFYPFGEVILYFCLYSFVASNIFLLV